MNAQDPSAQSPLKIVVAALTYKRPEGISKLLGELGRQVRNPERPYELTALIVDNDATGSGRAAVEAFHGRFEGLKIIYVIEPEPGIPFARNRALDSAPDDTDLFCFIDDDEWPVPGWIDAMLDIRAKTKADCVYGPVEPVYPPDPPRFFVNSGVFERKKNEDGQQITYAASNNVMFDYRLVRSWGLRFEEKMRFTGGTDYLFFNQAFRKGMKIHWSGNALVYDIIPRSRMTWKWVLQRQYRLGNTFAVSEVLSGNRKRLFFRLCYGIARTGLGVAMLPAFIVSPRRGMRALTHALRGAGMVAGILGHSYQEYRPDADGKVS